MTPCCPCCGRPFDAGPLEAEIADREDLVRDFCRQHGIVVRFDGSVSEKEFGIITGRAASTVKNARLYQGETRSFKDDNGRNRYWVRDIALYMLTESKRFKTG